MRRGLNHSLWQDDWCWRESRGCYRSDYSERNHHYQWYMISSNIVGSVLLSGSNVLIIGVIGVVGSGVTICGRVVVINSRGAWVVSGSGRGFRVPGRRFVVGQTGYIVVRSTWIRKWNPIIANFFCLWNVHSWRSLDIFRFRPFLRGICGPDEFGLHLYCRFCFCFSCNTNLWNRIWRGSTIFSRIIWPWSVSIVVVWIGSIVGVVVAYCVLGLLVKIGGKVGQIRGMNVCLLLGEVVIWVNGRVLISNGSVVVVFGLVRVINRMMGDSVVVVYRMTCGVGLCVVVVVGVVMTEGIVNLNSWIVFFPF